MSDNLLKERSKIAEASTQGFNPKKMESALNEWLEKVEEQVNSIDEKVNEKVNKSVIDKLEHHIKQEVRDR